jgi:outer membrane immunogenic protein
MPATAGRVDPPPRFGRKDSPLEPKCSPSSSELLLYPAEQRRERGEFVMRKLIFVGIGLLVSGAASAADLQTQPQQPVKAARVQPPRYYDWTGFYLGINGGWGESRSRFNFEGLGDSTGHFGGSGWQAGGTAGFNYQMGPAVMGIESDGDWSNLSGSTNCPAAGLTCQVQNDWLATVRGRVGVAFDRFLPYVTGGLAVGDINANVSGIGSATATNAGWTVGGGFEYALGNNWSTKLEYLHVNLGGFDCGTACSATPPATVRMDEDLVRGGINYKFDWFGNR